MALALNKEILEERKGEVMSWLWCGVGTCVFAGIKIRKKFTSSIHFIMLSPPVSELFSSFMQRNSDMKK